MRIVLTFGCLVVLLPPATWPQTPAEYKSADSRVLVTPTGKQPGRESYESRIEFRGAGNKSLCTLDFSSESSEHGFGVVKAAWTPDEKFFVFSLTSSGGHQAWHAPILFYDRKTGIIHSLDDYQDGAGIAGGDFRLAPPNTVETATQKEEVTRLTLRLDSLGKPSPRREKVFFIRCDGGRTFRPSP